MSMELNGIRRRKNVRAFVLIEHEHAGCMIKIVLLEDML